MNSISCRVEWCDATHQDDTPTAAKHSKTFVESDTVTVVARWTERRDGRPSVAPHITVRSTTVAKEFGLDLSPREAVELCNLLCDLWKSGGVLSFAATLAAGAAVLAPHEDRKHDGQPHYVTEDDAR